MEQLKLGNKEIIEKKEILKELTEKPKITQEQRDLLAEAHKSSEFIVKKKGL